MKKRASKKKRKQTGHELRSLAAGVLRDMRRCVGNRTGRESLSCRKRK